MQRIAQGFFGDRHGNGVCERIVDDQVYDPAGSISPGVTVNMRVCPIEMPTVIYGSPHQPVPEQNGKVIGTGQKGAVFQKTVVGGSQCVMEDDPVGDGTITISFPSICWTVVSSFLSESKGCSARRGSCFSKASLGIPFLWAVRTMAVSAGRRYAAPGRHGSPLHAGQISFSEHPGSFPLKCQMKILLICPM